MDPTYRRRVFKVSKELDRLGLMCEQHKLQVGRRRGLPDWTTPSVPAGVSTSEHERVPAFFAWERADVQPALAAAIDAGGRPSSAQVTPTHSAPTSDQWASTPIHAITSAGGPASPPPTNISATPSVFSTPAPIMPAEQAATPIREPTIDLTSLARTEYAPATPASGMVTPVRPTRRTPPPPVSVPAYSGNSSAPLLLSPSSATAPSPRYKHGRRLREIDLARPSSADSYRSTPAGISTVAADRFKKRPSFRSPDWAMRRPNKRLAFLDSQVRLAEEQHKNADRAATVPAESPIDHQWDNRSAQSLYERRHYVLSGSDAQRVAKTAASEFLSEYPQENTVANSHRVDGVHVGPTIIMSETPRKSKPASVDEAVQVDLEPPNKPTVCVVDRTTQTDQLEAQPAGEVSTPVVDVAQTTTFASSKTRHVSASPQLMNPILVNPRYPQEPSTFRSQTTYRLDFSDRRAGR